MFRFKVVLTRVKGEPPVILSSAVVQSQRVVSWDTPEGYHS